MVMPMLGRTAEIPDAGRSLTGELRTGNISLNLSGLRGHRSPRWAIFSATSGQMSCRGMSSVEKPSSACQLLASHRHNPTAIKICAKQRKEYNDAYADHSCATDSHCQSTYAPDCPTTRN